MTIEQIVDSRLKGSGRLFDVVITDCVRKVDMIAQDGLHRFYIVLFCFSQKTTGTVMADTFGDQFIRVTLNLTTVGGLPATVAPPTGAGWTAPFAWSLAPGSTPLPRGLNLSPLGVLSGTPAAAGTYTFTVIVTDSSTTMKKSAKVLTIVVN